MGDKVMTVLSGEMSPSVITSWGPYEKYVTPIVSSDLFKSSTGFTEMAELINGRAAMIGALAALGAEPFGTGPFLTQFASVSPAVLTLLAMVTGASVYPKYKNFDGSAALEQLDMGLEDNFTSVAELTNGRLAM